MTDLGCRRTVGVLSEACRANVVALAVLAFGLFGPSVAVAGALADRMSGYIAGCTSALVAGDMAAFGDLITETETQTETVTVLGWRGVLHPGLTVSLVLRHGAGGRATGVCDVTYVVAGADPVRQAELDAVASGLTTASVDAGHKEEGSPSGPVYLSCAGARGMALFVDPRMQGMGFSVQVATVPPHRMDCAG